MQFPPLQRRPEAAHVCTRTDVTPARLQNRRQTPEEAAQTAPEDVAGARAGGQRGEARAHTQQGPARVRHTRYPVFAVVTRDSTHPGHLGHSSHAPADCPGLPESCSGPHGCRAPSQVCRRLLPEAQRHSGAAPSPCLCRGGEFANKGNR